MFLELLEKFEKEVLGGKIVAKRHDAREDFAMWLDKQAALQQPAQQTAGNACKKHDIDFCAECFPTTSRR